MHHTRLNLTHISPVATDSIQIDPFQLCHKTDCKWLLGLYNVISLSLSTQIVVGVGAVAADVGVVVM